MTDDEVDADAPRYSGRWAIILVTIIAVGMASYAWWHRRHAGEKSLEFWGPETAVLISRAPEVELVELVTIDANEPRPRPDKSARFGGQPLAPVRTKLVERSESVPGLNKVRTILLQDNAFAWEEPADRCNPRWQYALEFRDGDRRATVLISLDCPRVTLVGSDKTASIEPIAAPLGEFLSAQFPATASPDDPRTKPASQ
jgi:hypothetical protein